MESRRESRKQWTLHLQRPTRTVRPAEDSLRIWSRRRTTYALCAVVWAILAVLFLFTQGGWLVVSMCSAAAVLSAAATLKAIAIARTSSSTR